MNPDIIALADIKTDDRLRKDLGNIEELAASIKTYGIIQPISVERGTFMLIDGGRRLTALRSLAFPCLTHGKEFIWHDELSEDQRREIELEANVRRKEMTWQERCHSVAEIHRLKKRIAALDSDKWGMVQTGELLSMSAANVHYLCIVSDALKIPKHPVHNCTSVTEALKVLMRLRQEEAEALLSKKVVSMVSRSDIEFLGGEGDRETFEPGKPQEGAISAEEFMRRLKTSEEESILEEPSSDITEVPLSLMFHHGSCLDHMDGMKPESIDHILTDPPYGIDMDNLEQTGTGMANIDSVREEHGVEANLALIKSFLPKAFRVLKDKSFMVMWYDLDHHEKIQLWARESGFKVQKWPYIWVKTHRCMNQSAQYNFTKATEVAMVLRKGNATLVKAQDTNYSILENREQGPWGHPFVKPIKLWTTLLEAISLEGQTIYDPFAGVGSCPWAIMLNHRVPLACELNEVHYNKMLVRTSQWYTSTLRGKVKFI